MEKNYKNFFKQNKKRLKALAAAGLIAGSLAGCKKPSFQEEIDNLYVIKSYNDENFGVVVENTPCTNNIGTLHYHYHNIHNDAYYTTDGLACNTIKTDLFHKAVCTPILDELYYIEKMSDNLTEEEQMKLETDTFTEDDYTNLMFRIKFGVELKQENTKSK